MAATGVIASAARTAPPASSRDLATPRRPRPRRAAATGGAVGCEKGSVCDPNSQPGRPEPVPSGNGAPLSRDPVGCEKPSLCEQNSQPSSRKRFHCPRGASLRRIATPSRPAVARATGAGRAPVKQPRFATTLKQLCTDFAPCGMRPCVATGARSMVVRPCPPRSSPTRCWPRPCRAWDRSRRSRSRAPGSPTRRCTRCSASRSSGPGSARRSRPPSPAATCSWSCRPARASRSATSSPRSCART